MRMNNTSLDQNSSRIFNDVLLQKILLGCLLFTLSLLTVFGNLLVLHAIRTEKHLRTVSNLFILSLAFADLVVGLIVMPLSAMHIIAGRWPLSNAICQIWLSIDYVASTASIFNLILLSLDRYWAVVYPLLYLQNRSRKRAISFILTVWFVSLLWAPAIIFWPFLTPTHSDSLKPNECDTSFRSNKLFKTLTALVNFYIPLLTMILISCRIMVAIRSRSTMEFGRRISSSARKRMRRYDRTFTNASLTRAENETIDRDYIKRLSSDNINGQPTLVSVVVNPFENTNVQSDEPIESFIPNNSLCQPPTREKRTFRLSEIKPIRILFPSLTKRKESDKRKSEDLTRKYSTHQIMKNSASVSNNMKYSERLSNSNQISRSSSSDESSHTSYVNTLEQQILKPPENLPTFITTPISSICSPLLTISKTSSTLLSHSKKINIITLFDYIINPSRSNSLQKELKAARQLGMLVGVFTVTWLPYFILFLVVAWCQQCVSETVYTASIWLGYLNSTLNPLIYPLCNKHFRRAFRKICYCHRVKTKLPNLNGLHELHALHSIRHRR